MRRALIFVLLALIRIGSAQDTSPAQIAGFSDSIQEQDGKITRLDITAKLEVKIAGTYRVSFVLSSANGNSLRGDARSRLDQGSQVLKASFDAKQLGESLAQDGPYLISDAQLFFDETDAEPTLADRVDNGGSTAAYRLSDLYRDLYYFTGEFEAEPINRLPSGKFETLRVKVGVVTPGDRCGGWAELQDEAGHYIDFQNRRGDALLAPGKSEMILDFDGFKIARAGIDGPLVMRSITLSCGLINGPSITDHSTRLTAKFLAADFDNPERDFEWIVPTAPVLVAAGDSFAGQIRIKCNACNQAEELSIDGQGEADDPKIQFREYGNLGCSSSLSCWAGKGAPQSITTAADIAPGTYPIRLTGRAFGKTHTATVTVIVDAQLTEQKRQRAAELTRLQTEDAVAPIPPVTPPPASQGVSPAPATTFKTQVALRKIHAVLVLDRSASLNLTNSCEFLKAAATRFTRLFAEGRDAVAVLSYGNTVQRTLPMTDQFLKEGPERISKITCHDATNTGEALEIAQEELAQHEDPEAINTVILFTDGASNVLAANWPAKPRGCTGSVGPCTDPRTFCTEAPTGQIPALMVPINSSAIFEPTDTPEAREGNWYRQQLKGSCFGAEALSNFAYMPERDLHGVALAGSRPLERIVDGTNAGQIRLDTGQNRANAVSNQVENAARQLRSGRTNPAFVYVVGFAASGGVSGSLSYLRPLANDPKAATYNQNEPTGLVIVTDAPEGFFPSFQRVRESIVEHATVR